jgi:outer membrane lipoprotein SlyB
MRKLILAVTAATMAMPVAFEAPAQAQNRYYQSRSNQDGYYQGRVWRDNRGRMRCRRSNGTTGLIIGGAGGALVGRAVDGGRNRTVGTLVGAAAGALIGREVERNSGGNRYRCR